MVQIEKQQAISHFRWKSMHCAISGLGSEM